MTNDVTHEGPLDLTVEGALAQVTLAGDQNPLSTQTLNALHEALTTAEAEPAVRAFVVTHTGRWFSSGMDLTEVQDIAAGARDFFALLNRLSEGDLISVAAVSGQAVGGGVGLAAACDIVLSAPESRFSLAEALWGLLPATVHPFLRRRVGGAAARRLALTTAPILATEALRIGLVDDIVDSLPRAIALTTRRAVCVDRATVHRIKSYAAIYDPVRPDAEQQADTALRAALGSPGVITGITRWQETGRLPWE